MLYVHPVAELKSMGSLQSHRGGGPNEAQRFSSFCLCSLMPSSARRSGRAIELLRRVTTTCRFCMDMPNYYQITASEGEEEEAEGTNQTPRVPSAPNQSPMAEKLLCVLLSKKLLFHFFVHLVCRQPARRAIRHVQGHVCPEPPVGAGNQVNVFVTC